MSLSTGQQINQSPLVTIVPATQALQIANTVIQASQAQINVVLTQIETAANVAINNAAKLGQLSTTIDTSALFKLNMSNPGLANVAAAQLQNDLTSAGYTLPPFDPTAQTLNISWAPQTLQQANQQVLNLLR